MSCPFTVSNFREKLKKIYGRRYNIYLCEENSLKKINGMYDNGSYIGIYHIENENEQKLNNNYYVSITTSEVYSYLLKKTNKDLMCIKTGGDYSMPIRDIYIDEVKGRVILYLKKIVKKNN